MQIETEDDFSRIADDHPMNKQFMILTYSLGGIA